MHTVSATFVPFPGRRPQLRHSVQIAALFGWISGRIVRQISLVILTLVLIATAGTGPAASLERTAAEGLPIEGSVGASAEDLLPGRLPMVLLPADAERYRTIFALQEAGKWREAATVIGKVEDDLLLGHVLAQKYLHPTKYRSRYPELLEWTRHYADHPQANRIYRLAKRRYIGGWKSPVKPTTVSLRGNGPTVDMPGVRGYEPERKRSKATRAAVARHRSAMFRFIRQGSPTKAYRRLLSKEVSRLFDPVETALMRAQIAYAYFVFGKDERAVMLAEQSIEEANPAIEIAAWAGGLAAWRLGQTDRAGRNFETLAGWLGASRAARVAGAYWAARMHREAGRPERSAKWLEQAATVPGTFYGLLAMRTLGRRLAFDWALPHLAPSLLDRLLDRPAGRRAFALLQVGRAEDAENEFRKLYPSLPAANKPLIMTIAARHGMPKLAMRIAGLLQFQGHRPYYAALFPLPSWEESMPPEVDPALILAIVRKESRFDPFARSKRGARGLMQLMPRTAHAVAQGDEWRDRKRLSLHDVETNLTLGTRYIRRLMEREGIGQNMFKTVVAYNAGPGRLRKWERQIKYNDDPLLFIEAIPSPETRNHVEDVLRNLWMYRIRRGLSVPSLDRIVAGLWPQVDSVETAVAQDTSHVRN